MSKSSQASPILHSFRRCPFAIRVRVVLEEKNLEYHLIEENLSAPSAELLRVHPSGKVPVLIHEGQVLPESAIITEYLEEKFPAPALMPGDPLSRAQVRLWTHWCSEIFKPDLDLYKYEFGSLSADDQSGLIGRLREHLNRLETPLRQSPFLLGEQMTLADIHVFPFYRQLSRSRASESGSLTFPASLSAWLERMISRPSFVRAMATTQDSKTP